eukprot:gene4117-5151_t
MAHDENKPTIISSSMRAFYAYGTVLHFNGLIFQNCTISQFDNDTLLDQLLQVQYPEPMNRLLVRSLLYRGGSVIFSIHSTLLIRNCTITENYSTNGAICFNKGVLRIFNSKLQNNYSLMNAGFATINQSNTTIHNSTIQSNYCGGRGGAMHIMSGYTFIEKSVFAYNIGYFGGCFYLWNHSNVEIQTSFFYKNQANGGGGVCYLDQFNRIFLFSCRVRKNISYSIGGVFFVQQGATVVVSTSIVEDNIAASAAILESHTNSPVVLSSSLFRGVDPNYRYNSSHIATYQAGRSLMVRNCLFTNMTGTIFSCSSLSNSYIVNCTFTYLTSLIIDIYSRGSAQLVSVYFENCTSPDYLISLSNQAQVLFFDFHVTHTSSKIIIRIKNRSMSRLSLGYFRYNIVKEEMISLTNGFNLTLESCFFADNVGVLRGMVLSSDQTGELSIYNTIFENNTGSYGSAIFFRKRRYIDLDSNLSIGCGTSKFQNLTFINNIAKQSGALVYYDEEIKCPFICRVEEGCYFSNNHAYNGELYNSNYHTFIVSPIENVVPFQPFVAFVQAFDYYNKSLRGRENIFFSIKTSSNVHLTGVKHTVLHKNSYAYFYQLMVTQSPGTVFELNFTSEPFVSSSIGANKIITISDCPNITKPFDVYNNNTIYCLYKKDIFQGGKIIVGVITVVIGIIALICLGITIKHRKHRVISYSNEYFLYIIIFGCILALGGVGSLFKIDDAA